MTSRELRNSILLILKAHSDSGAPEFVTDEQLSLATKQPVHAVRQQLDILEDGNLTTTANAHQGRRARISPSGQLAAEELENSLAEPLKNPIGFEE